MKTEDAAKAIRKLATIMFLTDDISDDFFRFIYINA